MHCQCVGTTIPDLGDAVTIDDFDQASAAVLRRNETLLRITSRRASGVISHTPAISARRSCACRQATHQFRPCL